MKTNLGQAVEQAQKHLETMITKEKPSGDFYLAAVVQDSLLYTLHHHAESRNLMELAAKAAEVSVQSVADTMERNEFAVSEAIRGVMHSMVSLGGSPVQTSVAVAMGGLAGIQSTIPGETGTYMEAVAIGILAAAEDLGLNHQSE